MTINTNPVRTLQLLQKAVEERGEDYVYPVEWKTASSADAAVMTLCMYVQPDGSGPACIAGYVMHEYGASLDFLKKHEGETTPNPGRELGVDTMSLILLFDAQGVQDQGLPWGQALARARMRYASESF